MPSAVNGGGGIIEIDGRLGFPGSARLTGQQAAFRARAPDRCGRVGDLGNGGRQGGDHEAGGRADGAAGDEGAVSGGGGGVSGCGAGLGCVSSGADSRVSGGCGSGGWAADGKKKKKKKKKKNGAAAHGRTGGCGRRTLSWGYWRMEGWRMWPAWSTAGSWRKPADVAGGHWGQ